MRPAVLVCMMLAGLFAKVCGMKSVAVGDMNCDDSISVIQFMEL